MNALLRETTASADTLLRSVMMSSVMPSLKYSCSGSPLMLTNGSTQIPIRAEAAGALEPVPAAPGPPCRAIIVLSARSSDWNCGPLAFSPQPSMSVVWIARTSIGSRAPSKRAGTSVARSAASRASPRTQRDATEDGVQTTSTALAAFSSSSIWSSNCWPASISGSHQTDQPCASMAATSGATRALSLRAYETKMSAIPLAPVPGARRGPRCAVA